MKEKGGGLAGNRLAGQHSSPVSKVGAKVRWILQHHLAPGTGCTDQPILVFEPGPSSPVVDCRLKDDLAVDRSLQRLKQANEPQAPGGLGTGLHQRHEVDDSELTSPLPPDCLQDIGVDMVMTGNSGVV